MIRKKTKNKELIRAVLSVSVETGSLVCLGCGHKHSCGIRGCAILREAADALEAQSAQLEAERDAYRTLGTVEHLTELVEAEQKRCEGCIRCERKTCGTCYHFGLHPDICQKCENQSHYSAKPFCAHCGRDLRGESHEQH